MGPGWWGVALNPSEPPFLHLNCGGWGEREGREGGGLPHLAGQELRPGARCPSSPSQLPHGDVQRRQLFYRHRALAVACVHV